MRKNLPLLLLPLFVLACFVFQPCGFSADERAAAISSALETVKTQTPKTYHWYHKLWRGTVNMVTSPADAMTYVNEISLEENHFKGFTVGVYKGLKSGFTRLGTGLVDFLTFPFNFPNRQKAPLYEPEFYWQRPIGTATTILSLGD